MKVVVCPAALKGVLSAQEAAAALVQGLGGGEAVPLADGGEGTAAVLHAALGGEWRQASVSDPLGRAVEASWLLIPDAQGVVESAEAIGLRRLAPDELDPMRASSRGLGELLLAAGESRSLLVGLGDSATVDGGAGLREVLAELPAPTTVLCDVRSPLLDAARIFARQKGASPEQAAELEQRLTAMEELRAFADLPGAGAAGGLGAALAALGAELVQGAEYTAEAVDLPEKINSATLVVTGEGSVDATSLEGKVSGVVARLCREAGVRCVVFGGRVELELPGAEMHALSGDPAHAQEDLIELGARLREA
jgi:glycerate 2-kinase